MPKGAFLGEFELLVSLAVERLRDDAYGAAIQREMERRADRSAALGAVYATLVRLEEKKVLRAFAGAPTGERGGRARRCYALTLRGRAAVVRSHGALARMMDGLESGLGVV